MAGHLGVASLLSPALQFLQFFPSLQVFSFRCISSFSLQLFVASELSFSVATLPFHPNYFFRYNFSSFCYGCFFRCSSFFSLQLFLFVGSLPSRCMSSFLFVKILPSLCISSFLLEVSLALELCFSVATFSFHYNSHFRHNSPLSVRVPPSISATPGHF